MSVEDYQQRIIESLAQNEEAIERLYKAYSGTFIENEQFWFYLAIEEKNHADWLRHLSSRMKGKGVYFKEGRFKLDAITFFREYVEKQIAALGKELITNEKALAIALDIENALLEKNFFEVFDTDSAEIKATFVNLAKATEEHRIRVKKALEEKSQDTHFT